MAKTTKSKSCEVCEENKGWTISACVVTALFTMLFTATCPMAYEDFKGYVRREFINPAVQSDGVGTVPFHCTEDNCYYIVPRSR